MRHNSCSLACYARFNTTVIPRPEEITFSSETTLVVCVSVLASLLTLLLIGLIVCLVRRHTLGLRHMRNLTIESPAAGNDQMITSTREDAVINMVNEIRLRQLSQTDEDGQPQDRVQAEPLIDNTNV
ncbi:hypothetical protein Btru_045621 [Bulinus truncatus]|nr:hypothetical protein Btru_045621 [Bulinus truncatus]